MLRLTPRAYAAITLVCLALLALIIVTGGAVRVTGSGLGCTDWPTCENNHLVAPLSLHPMVEFGNRVFTGIVGIAVIIGVLGALVRVPRRRDLTWLSVSLVLGVVAQAVLGGVSVKHKLDPRFVMAHFLLSQVIVWAAVVLRHRAREPEGPAVTVVSRGTMLLGRAQVVLAGAVLFVGTMVTGSGPHGGDENVVRLGFAPHHITKVHGALVWALIALTVILVWKLHHARASATLLRKAEVVMVCLLLQGAVGYLQYALDLPPGLVLLHIAGATAAWIAVLWFNLSFRERYEDVGLAAFDGDADVSRLSSVFQQEG